MNDAKLRAAKPRDKAYKLTDSHRLYLLVTPSGGKLWRWNYPFASKQKSMAFGSYPMDILVDARATRDEARVVGQFEISRCNLRPAALYGTLFTMPFSGSPVLPRLSPSWFTVPTTWARANGRGRSMTGGSGSAISMPVAFWSMQSLAPELAPVCRPFTRHARAWWAACLRFPHMAWRHVICGFQEHWDGGFPDVFNDGFTPDFVTGPGVGVASSSRPSTRQQPPEADDTVPAGERRELGRDLPLIQKAGGSARAASLQPNPR